MNPKKQWTLPYRARDQFLALHQRQQRWAVIVAHRRAGKTVACINELMLRALTSTAKNPRYAYIAPYRSQAKNVAWDILKDAVKGLGAHVNNGELTVRLMHNNATVRLYGGDRPDALRGIYNDGVIIDEFADIRPSLWGQVIRPTLIDRRGWAIFIGTPKGKNAFYELYHKALTLPDQWFTLFLSGDTSGILPAEELADMKYELSEADYDQEVLCSFNASRVGTYFASILRECEASGNFRTEGVYDPSLPVEVTCDLGWRDSTVLWFFQRRPEGIAIIDCEEGHVQPLAYYYTILDSKPYKYSTIWLPHDARAKTLQTGKSIIEQFTSHYKHKKSIEFKIVPSLSVQDGIEAVRMMLPKCVFDILKCDNGIEGLREYRREWIDHLKIFKEQPLHDWSSDYADAFRYLAIVANAERKKPPTPLKLMNDGYILPGLSSIPHKTSTRI